MLLFSNYANNPARTIYKSLRGGLTVDAVDSESSPGRDHCVVFLGKTHSASLTQLGVTLRWARNSL